MSVRFGSGSAKPSFFTYLFVAGEPVEFPENAPQEVKVEETPEDFTYEVSIDTLPGLDSVITFSNSARDFFFFAFRKISSFPPRMLVRVQDFSTLSESVGTVKVGLSKDKLRVLKEIPYSSTNSDITEEK